MRTKCSVGGSAIATNRAWPQALKREIVSPSFAPGASVSTVARHYDVNANQVFSWRKRYRDEPRVAAGAEAGDRVAVVCAGCVGLNGCPALRRECEPSVQLAEALSRRAARGRRR